MVQAVESYLTVTENVHSYILIVKNINQLLKLLIYTLIVTK